MGIMAFTPINYRVVCPNYVTPNGYYYTGSGFSAY